MQNTGGVTEREREGEISKSKAWGVRRRGKARERESEGEGKGPEMQSTLASFTEQATLTHREGDYREGKAG